MSKSKTKKLISPEEVWKMYDVEMVNVNVLTLLRRVTALTGCGSNPTEADKKTSKEIKDILDANDGEREISLSCKDIRRLLNKEDVSNVSFRRLN